MRTLTLPLMLATSLAMTAPTTAPAQDLGDVITGIADSLLQQELDKQAYIAAQNANTVAAYQNYLKKFPNGIYKANAERALAKLGAPVEGSVDAAALAESKLGITASQRAAVQRELTRLGYPTGGADGVWGPNTRNAIAAWQRDRKDKITGYVTEAQLPVLLNGTVILPPTDDTATGTPVQIEAALQLTRAQRIAVQKQLNTLGYAVGVADGLWGANTRTAIKAWQKANKKTQTGYVTATQVNLIADQAAKVSPPPVTSNAAALEEQLLQLSVEERADLQVRLIRLGYNTGRTDGTFSTMTRQAIGAWQADEGEQVTGYLTADQVRAIWVETGR